MAAATRLQHLQTLQDPTDGRPPQNPAVFCRVESPSTRGNTWQVTQRPTLKSRWPGCKSCLSHLLTSSPSSLEPRDPPLERGVIKKLPSLSRSEGSVRQSPDGPIAGRARGKGAEGLPVAAATTSIVKSDLNMTRFPSYHAHRPPAGSAFPTHVLPFKQLHVLTHGTYLSFLIGMELVPIPLPRDLTF